MLLGKVLRHIRVFNNYSQTDLANKLKVSRSYMSEIESGIKVPTIEFLQKYSDFANIPLSNIILFAEQKSNKGIKSKMRRSLTRAAINLLDWIVGEEEKSEEKA